MKVLIVHAHPEPQSFCAALKNLALQELTAAGHQVQVSDLYELNFDPVAKSQDFLRRERPDYLVYALEQRAAQKANALAPDITRELEKVLWADFLIFNFPIFWFSVPAILKGWIDRVLISGVCYGGLRFYDNGGLKGRRALVCITLGGQEHMFGPGAIHGPFEDMLRPLLRGTLHYVGLEVLPPFVAWHVPYISQEARLAFLEKYRETLKDIQHTAPLEFPRMADFDEALGPRKDAVS
jgi:NAD(P)H dehydrogenase (quinone)